MRLPIEWLKEYISIESKGVQSIADGLTLSGSNSEGVHFTGEQVKKIVVGQIVEMEQHPDAEKLKVCQVNIGEEMIQIVTNASNVKVNDLIPVALHGAILADGMKIKKGKLRGVLSQGMFCSFAELGVSSSSVPKAYEEGVLVLEGNPELGMDIMTYLKLDEAVIELEITPNRPDCLSILGMARETAATFQWKLKELPHYTFPEKLEASAEGVKVHVEAKDLCRRYQARLIENVVVKSSPLWMQMRLIQAGMRPVNTIVDLTNYVMLETGQPIHAFDADKLNTLSIEVRRAKAKEKIITLDDQERTLDEEMLVICNQDQAIAIAGLMGGADTEVSEATQNVLIEIASFDKTSVRRTSKVLGLRSEASSRFEKGVSEERVELAMSRLCYWIEELNIGQVTGNENEYFEGSKPLVKIAYTADYINEMIGTNLSESEIQAYLERLEIKTEKGYALIPPYRLDLQKKVDLVEEVARMYGYQNIPMTLPKMNTWGAYTNGQRIEEKAKQSLFASGVDEMLTYSFVSPKDIDLINIPENSLFRQQVMLKNPLGEEYSAMRRTLMPNVLQVLARNESRKIAQAKMFELGSIFIPKQMPVTEAPLEKKMLTLGMYGGVDFFSLKGSLENLFEALGIEGHEYIREENHASFHPGRCANIVWKGHFLGTLGEIHPQVMENFGFNERVYLAELEFNSLMQIAQELKKFKPIPKFPAVERDLAVVLDETIEAGRVEKCIQEAAGPLLESVVLFDIYQGEQVPSGQKSMAYALVFRGEETLTDEIINPIFEKILQALKQALNADLR